MINKKIKTIKEQDDTGVDAAVARGQGQIPADKVTNFKNMFANMYNATQKKGAAGTAPSKSTGSSEETKQTGQTSSTGGSDSTDNKATAGQPGSDKEKVEQSTSDPKPTQGFVELDKDATDASLAFLSSKLSVDKESIKKLSTTRGIRILIDPKYLKIQ